MKRKNRKLHKMQQEATALLDYLLAEAFFSNKEMHYRLKLPYGSIQPNDTMSKEVELVVEISVYFDGEMTDERDEANTRTFKITGPNKGRH